MKKRFAILALLLFLPALVWGDTLTYIQGVVGVTAAEEPNEGIVGASSGYSFGYSINTAQNYFTPYVASQSGTVRYGHIYVDDSNGETVCIALYTTDGTRRIYGSGTRTDNSAGWITVDGGEGGFEITASTTYWLSCGSSTGNFTAGWGELASHEVRYMSGYPGCNPATLTNSGLEGDPYNLIIIWNNTPEDPS